MDVTVEVVLDYYAKVTHDHDNGADNGSVCSPDVILPPVPEITQKCTTIPSPHQYLLPSVIIWDPLQQLDSFKDGIQCPNSAHNLNEEKYFLRPKKSTNAKYWWQAGQRQSLMPRLLSSSSWPTVLLSKIYYCDSKIKHKSYIGHDPEILSMIPSSELNSVPFSLLHRTGFTKELSETVVSLATSGMNLEDIEQVIYQQHITNFAQCKAKFEEDKQCCLQNAGKEVEEGEVVFPEYRPIGIPSMEMILGSLLDNFLEQQMYYYQRMSEVSAEILLMGHFFKFSQQMGTVRSDSKRWTSMYNYIFTVMNEKGQVLAWQATKGTSIQDVSVLLVKVQQRLFKQGIEISLILTPECCKQKELITSIFGSNVSVKMDPQFGYQRLEKKFKIRKGDHNHVVKCLQDFRFIFHKSTDLDLEHNEDTPAPDVILGNLHSFTSQWKAFKGEAHERLLHDPALRELEAIKSSVAAGCLSNIPPNSGAKHVKELKSYLDPVLNKRFLNAQLAVPALVVLFYYWNENHKGSEEALPINSYRLILEETSFTPTTERFGLIDNQFQAENKEQEQHVSSSFIQDLNSYQSQLFSLLWETHGDSYSNHVSLTTTGNLKLKAILHSKIVSIVENNYLVLRNVKSICPEYVSPISIWHYHVVPCSTALFNKCEVDSGFTRTSRLQNNLEVFGGCIVNQQGCDNSFFAALLHGLNTLLMSLEVENLTEFMEVKEHLNSIGCNVDVLRNDEMSSGVAVLQEIISAEWHQNKDEYNKLVGSSLIQVNQENENLAEMSNILPVAAVKVLRLSLIIFTSMDSFPVVPVVSAEKPLTSKCLYIGYSLEGLGSYHSVTISPAQPLGTLQKPKYTCRCGLGSSKNKKERKFCIQTPGMYLTRCECFRNGGACNYLCRCFNCANPRGTSTESRASQAPQKTRLRTRHKLQNMKKPFQIQSPKTSWSEKECLALEFLITALQFSSGVTMSELTPEIVAKEYENLLQSCKGKAFLKPKSMEEIKEHFNLVVNSVERFHTLFQNENENHWNDDIHQQDVEISDANQFVVIVESSE